MPTVTIIAVPYDSGQRAVGMGRGPLALLEHGLEGVIQEQGYSVELRIVEADEALPTEVGTSFDLYRKVSAEVKKARDKDSFPLVLSGNCAASIGTVAGSGLFGLGVVWFDAHGDFNTPETSSSGYLDGMSLAALTGRCWRDVTSTVPDFAPMPEYLVLHLGARDLDEPEKEAFAASDVTLLDAAALNGGGLVSALQPEITRLSGEVGDVYLHLDLDVLDPGEACANSYAASGPTGGLTVAQVEEAIELIKPNLYISAVGISAYDPAFDPEGRTLQAALRFASLALPTL
jgi:arginase